MQFPQPPCRTYRHHQRVPKFDADLLGLGANRSCCAAGLLNLPLGINQPLRMFSRVLVENLSSLLAADNVVPLPQRRPTPLDYQVEVDVTRFDADLSGRAVLDARSKVFGKDGEPLIEEGRSTIVEAAVGSDSYEDIVAAMSRSIIANTIEQQRAS